MHTVLKSNQEKFCCTQALVFRLFPLPARKDVRWRLTWKTRCVCWRFIQQSQREFSEKSQAARSKRILQPRVRSHRRGQTSVTTRCISEGKSSGRKGYRCGHNLSCSAAWPAKSKKPIRRASQEVNVLQTREWKILRKRPAFGLHMLQHIIPNAGWQGLNCVWTLWKMKMQKMKHFCQNFVWATKQHLIFVERSKGKTSAFSLMFDLPYLLCETPVI